MQSRNEANERLPWIPPRPFSGLPRPLLMAHRGASRHAPENTLPAFTLALAQGAQVLELDVQLSADGEAVILHDASLARTTDSDAAVANLTYAEIARLDAGARFVDPLGGQPYRQIGVRVPTLSALRRTHPNAPLNIELKGTEPALLRAVLQSLAGLPSHQVLLTAQAPAMKAQLRAARPPFALGLDAAEGVEVARAYLRHPGTWAAALAQRLLGRDLLGRWRGVGIPATFSGQALQAPLRHAAMPGGWVPTRGFVRGLHNAGLELHIWGVEEVADAKRCLAAGVDGIFTDDPAALYGLFLPYWRRQRRAATQVRG